MATDEPLREEQLPTQSSDRGSEKSRSPNDDQPQPMIGDLVHRTGESSEHAARDAMMRPGDPAGQIEQLGLTTPPASDTGTRDHASQPEGEEATANKPPSASDNPPIEDPVSAGKSASAAAAEVSVEEPVDAAQDAPPIVRPAASPVSNKTSDDRGASLAAVDESSPSNGPTAESMDDSAGAVAPDSSLATTAD